MFKRWISLSTGWRDWFSQCISAEYWFIRWVALSNVWTTGAWFRFTDSPLSFYCFASSSSSFYEMKTKSRDVNRANVSPLRFLRIYSWDQVKRLDIIDNAFPHHPLVNFLPLKQDYSLTTKLLMRALKRKLFWVSSHDLRWGNKTTSKYCRCLVSASNKIKYKWLELSCINGNRSFQGLPVFCWSNYTFKNKHVGLVSKVDFMLTHSFPIKCQELAKFKKIPLKLYFRVCLWKNCQNCSKPQNF